MTDMNATSRVVTHVATGARMAAGNPLVTLTSTSWTRP
jgi:hypothetical protein